MISTVMLSNEIFMWTLSYMTIYNICHSSIFCLRFKNLISQYFNYVISKIGLKIADEAKKLAAHFWVKYIRYYI